MLPRWFLILNGMALLLLGGALLVLRLRETGPGWSARHGVGLIWALLCIGVGAAQLLMAGGVLEQPGAPRAIRAPRPAVEFPTDR